MSVKTDVKEMLAAGVHFGHKTSRWHPKMAPYIHSKRGESHVIDLFKTEEELAHALKAITDAVAGGKQVLFVGTKRQAKGVVKQAAIDAKMPFVTERWLGGMLTNQKTISGRVRHLKKQEERMESGELAQRFNKLEVQRFQEEIDALNRMFGGIKDMNGNPGVVFVTDVINDHIAVAEANRLNIPVVGICDTNADPSDITFPVPANDDAIKALQLLCRYVQEAIEEGRTKVKTPAKKADKEDKKEEK